MNTRRILLAQALDDVGEDDYIISSSITYYGLYQNVHYRSDDAVDEVTDQWGDVAGGLAVPPAVAALTMFLGSSFAIVAVIGWAQSGASDAPRVVEMVCSWYKRAHQVLYQSVRANHWSSCLPFFTDCIKRLSIYIFPGY